MTEYVIEMQVRTRAAVAWIRLMVALRLLIGRNRAARWALGGMHRLTAYRIRHIKGGGWGRWHRGMMSVPGPDDVFWEFVT